MIKYVLSVLILILTLRLSESYIAKRERSLNLVFELCDFVAYLDKKMRVSRAPTHVLARGFKGALLSELGFIDAITTDRGVREAFLELDLKDNIDEKSYEILDGLFSQIGSAGADYERERISACYNVLSEQKKLQADNFQKEKRIIRTLSFSFALGIIILLL